MFAQLVQINLLTQRRGESVDGPGGIRLAAVEAFVDTRLYESTQRADQGKQSKNEDANNNPGPPWCNEEVQDGSTPQVDECQAGSDHTIDQGTIDQDGGIGAVVVQHG